MHVRSLPFFAIQMALVATLGCRDKRPATDERGTQASHDTSPIDASAFHVDSNVTRHVLYMPFGEAAARLGSLKFEARSHFVFSRGGEEYEQNDIYTATQDSLGNFHVVLDTPHSQIELYLVGETVYVRHDKGHLRHKPRRDVEAEAWCELAFSSVRQALEVFQPHLQFLDPRPDKTTKRQTVRYTLALSDEAKAPTEPAAPLPKTALPVPPPARWRELARPLDLQGSIWLDVASGVMTRVALEGRLEIADRQVRPTQVSLRFDAAITDAAKVPAVKPPESIAEFRRKSRPRDMLGFFEEHLDRPKKAKTK